MSLEENKKIIYADIKETLDNASNNIKVVNKETWAHLIYKITTTINKLKADNIIYNTKLILNDGIENYLCELDIGNFVHMFVAIHSRRGALGYQILLNIYELDF